MTLDKFTIKAQEAVQQAVNTAQMNGQQVIEPVHILKGVLEKAKDVTTFIFQKLGVRSRRSNTCQRCRADSLISLMTLIMYSYAPRKRLRNGVTSSWHVNLCYWPSSPSTPPPHAS